MCLESSVLPERKPLVIINYNNVINGLIKCVASQNIYVEQILFMKFVCPATGQIGKKIYVQRHKLVSVYRVGIAL